MSSVKTPLKRYCIYWTLVMLVIFAQSFTNQLYAASETPPKMLGQKMVYDPVNNRIILFGGSSYSNRYTFYGDTWSFDVQRVTWSKLSTNGSPSARFNIGMVYDNDQKKIVLFGGFSASDRIGDTWTYDITSNTWMNARPQLSPPRRSDMGIAYDSGAKKVIIFGGYGLEDRKYGDTWAYDVATNTWTQMFPKVSPTARYGGVMVYDTYTRKVLLFGGHMDQNGRSIGYENEIWAYEYESDNWEKIPTTNKPPARYWHDLAYDPVGYRIILFSGSQGGGNDLGDTWIYSCRDNIWNKVTSTVNPSPRSQPSMAYDVAMKKTVMFGGADFKAEGEFLYYNDVWALDENSQWKKLSGETQPEPTPSEPSIPGFQPITLTMGMILAALILLHLKYRRMPIKFQ